MWFCATFFNELKVNVLVRSLYKDLGEDLGFGPTLISLWLEISVAHVDYFHDNLSPTKIGLFSVVHEEFGFFYNNYEHSYQRVYTYWLIWSKL